MNALRYIPENLHEDLASEFMEELLAFGRIYAYRFRPEGRIFGRDISTYHGNCIEGKAFQVMIDNNLDFEIALYPYELVTYGETGQVCQNWSAEVDAWRVESGSDRISGAGQARPFPQTPIPSRTYTEI